VESTAEAMSIMRRVRSLRFEARSEAATGWDGIGTGAVAVSEPAPGVVVFDEAGTWRPTAADRSEIGFTNVFRWSALGSALRLEHLRFGAMNPVLLFDLVPGADGVWRQVSPHQCKEDCYTGMPGGHKATEALRRRRVACGGRRSPIDFLCGLHHNSAFIGGAVR
jgi:hypothetical protein